MYQSNRIDIKKNNSLKPIKVIIFAFISLLLEYILLPFISQTLLSRALLGSFMLLPIMIYYYCNGNQNLFTSLFNFKQTNALKLNMVGFAAGIFFVLLIFSVCDTDKIKILLTSGKIWKIPFFILGSPFSNTGLAFVIISLTEEIIFRGILFTSTLRWLSLTPAVIITSVVFMFFHFSSLIHGEPFIFVFVFIMQIMMCLYFNHSRLFLPSTIIWHYTYDMLLYTIGMLK